MKKEAWLESLSPEQRSQIEKKLEVMKTFGLKEAEIWMKSEVEEDIPQYARFLVLRRIWPEIINDYRKNLRWIQSLIEFAENEPNGCFADAGASLKTMLDAGVSETDIANVARFIAYEVAFSVLNIIDEGYDRELSGEVPTWSLMEADQKGHLTGREIGSLHESLLSLDPSGREGKPS